MGKLPEPLLFFKKILEYFLAHRFIMKLAFFIFYFYTFILVFTLTLKIEAMLFENKNKCDK